MEKALAELALLTARCTRSSGCVCLTAALTVSPPLQVPFTVLQGEGVEYLGHANDAVIAISNYRLHIKLKDSVVNVSAALSLVPGPKAHAAEV